MSTTLAAGAEVNAQELFTVCRLSEKIEKIIYGQP